MAFRRSIVLKLCEEPPTARDKGNLYLPLMTQPFYFDTSIFGGMYDTEFEREITLLFERVSLGQIICVYANLTESELAKAPQNTENFFQDIKDVQKKGIRVSPEGLLPAQIYVYENVAGKTSLVDCTHIPTATLNKVVVLVS